jgi:hypothetical protein
MKTLLKRLIVLAALVGAAYLAWGQRDRIALLSNNNFKIQGTWYQVEMDRKGIVPFEFTERIIVSEGLEWGSFELRRNTELEVMVGNQLTEYHLSFPDDNDMVWSVERDGELVPALIWRR